MASVIRGSDNFDSVGGNAVKAWVNFNGTGTVAIRAGLNVSSITDNGVGDYTVNFTSAFADANYTPVVSGGAPGAAALLTNLNTSGGTGTEVAPTSAAFRFNTLFGNASGNVTDCKYVNVAVLR